MPDRPQHNMCSTSQRPETDSGHERSGESALRGTQLGSLLHEAWPTRLPKRPLAGLPPAVFYALRGLPRRSPLATAATHLDRTLPGWPEQAARILTQSSNTSFGDDAQRLATLLAHRPLRDPQELLRAAAVAAPDRRLWLLTALSGTDAVGVRDFWLADLRKHVRAASEACDTAVWFAFLHAFLSDWLTYADFRDCLAEARVLAAAARDGDYRSALTRLGLAAHPRFAKWYRQVVYDIAHQPDVSLSFRAAGWVRDFAGEEYLWDALSGLTTRPDMWWPLHVLRWCSGIDPGDGRVISRLATAPPAVLCLVSLLRGDLCTAVAQALGEENYESAIEWLKTTPARLPLDLRFAESRIRPWAERVGEPMSVAVGALCSVDPPADYRGPEEPVLRRREFARRHLLPEFDRVVDNLLYVHALRRKHFDAICRQALRGLPTAIRALSLCPDRAAEGAPILFRLSREGSAASRRVAQESLEVLRARARVEDLSDYEKRLDLASAWADAGLDGRPGLVWWDVKGYRIKLSVAAGKVSLEAFSEHRRLRSVPQAVREDPRYEEIKEARSQLAKMYRYFRRRFEVAMVERVCYRAEQLETLLANPVVRSLVSRLILLVDGRPFLWTARDPMADAASPEGLPEGEEIQIAHPVELGGRGALGHWQEHVIQSRIAQPFKQVFRECYVLAPREQDEQSCARFAGHPLVARRAFALLRSRGYSPGRGEAVREWPELGLVAHIRWAQDEERAGRLLAALQAREAVTSGPVWFTANGPDPMRLGSVSPVVVSETLRDADLLASRAAAGELGYTSEQTLQLRATLVRYLARALGLTTIYVAEDNRHALVEGSRAMYRVHLASGSAFLEESRRHLDTGRVMGEPFRDLVAESMDTVTARVVGLIGALANDHQISDPEFLSQL